MTQAPLSAGQAGHSPAFAPGDELCARFRILRFLAQGGMGEVYEADDLELGGRVALKTIRPEIASDTRALQRFKREIMLARKVTHPNVCRIFDVFHHATAAPDHPVTFLAMEMLHGETLAARLSRTGPLAVEEALPIVEHLAAGLHAAHHAGIVHRDLKPGNVILVADGDGTRAVVTDFGLARGQDDPASSSSAALGMVGTSAYMSPEQVEGHEVTAASDIYSLGVVVYEMVTGIKPFQSDTALATAVLRLKEAPRPPRVHRPDLDPRWNEAILRCLAVPAEHRFRTVDEVAAALGARRGEAGRPGPHADRARRTGYVVAAALAAVAALTGLATSASSRGAAASPSGARAAAAPRRSVALLGFKNLSGRAESAWLSTALSEMLGMELAAGETLRIIPGENVARMKVELELPEADSLAPDTLARIRANLGTDLIVLGSYLAQGEKAGERLRLDLRVQDTAAGELVASVTETGTEADLLDFVSRGGDRLREKLGVASPTSAAGALRVSFPASAEAARLYSEGLARIRNFDALAARDLLQRAVAADPTFPLAHAALAEAWSALGYDAEAGREAKTALDLSARLPREERLGVEGRHYAITSQWDKAVETYRVLWGFFPDNVEYGLRLAAAQSSAGRAHDALATVEALRRTSAASDPRVDLAEAVAAARLSQYARARAAAARAVRSSEAQRAPLLAAEARFQQATALRDLGEYPAAIAAYEEARSVFARAGDRRGEGTALYGMGVTLWWQRRMPEAERLFEQGLAVSQAVGYQKGVSRALSGLGMVFSMQGDHAAAGSNYAKALVIDRELGDLGAVTADLHNIGYTFRFREDLANAARMYREALDVARQIDDQAMIASLLNALGWVLLDRGQPADALARFEEALSINRRIGRRKFEALNVYNVGYMRYYMADLPRAREKLEESLALRLQLGDSAAMENRFRLAGVLLEEGRPAEGEALAREAVSHFQSVSNVNEELLSRTVLIDCLLAQRKLAEARESAARATAISKTSQTRDGPRAVAIAVARLDAASGRPEAAIRSLEEIIAQAKRAGFGLRELEARLALGEIEMNHGREAAGRARLQAVERDARARRCLLIAGKAAQQMRTADLR